MAFYHWDQQDLILAIHLQPRSQKTAILGMYREQLKIKITAPPVDGKANAELTQLLATTFGVAKSQVHLIKGHSSHAKLYRITSPKKLPEFISPPENGHL